MQLLEKIGNSSLGSLFLDVVLVQVTVDYQYQVHIRLLEGLGNLLKASLLLSRLGILLGKISEVKLDVVSKMEFQWRNHLPRRHEVLEIHDLGKHLHRGSSLHGLLRHLRKHFARRSRNTAHDSVRELVLVLLSPSSFTFTTTAFFPAYLPARMITTFPGLRNFTIYG